VEELEHVGALGALGRTGFVWVVGDGVQVVRPSKLTSSGQCGAASHCIVFSPSPAADAANVVAVAEAIARAAELPLPLLSCLDMAATAVVVGF
jgi:hypothetical protein